MEKNAHLTLLQALQIADFEELPLKHDICEVLSKLGASDPDTSSTVSVSALAPGICISDQRNFKRSDCLPACTPICPDNFWYVVMQGGKLLLHWSAQFGDAQMCRRYLRSFPLVDPQDERGNTPLHLAVCNDRRCVNAPKQKPSTKEIMLRSHVHLITTPLARRCMISTFDRLRPKLSCFQAGQQFELPKIAMAPMPASCQRRAPFAAKGFRLPEAQICVRVPSLRMPVLHALVVVVAEGIVAIRKPRAMYRY